VPTTAGAPVCRVTGAGRARRMRRRTRCRPARCRGTRGPLGFCRALLGRLRFGLQPRALGLGSRLTSGFSLRNLLSFTLALLGRSNALALGGLDHSYINSDATDGQHRGDDTRNGAHRKALLLLGLEFGQAPLVGKALFLFGLTRAPFGLESNPKFAFFPFATFAVLFGLAAALLRSAGIFRGTDTSLFCLPGAAQILFSTAALVFLLAPAVVFLLLDALFLDAHQLFEGKEDAILFLLGHPFLRGLKSR
jgi:hypothetical protein